MFARARVSLPTEEGNSLIPERALTEFLGDANYHADRVARLSGY